MKIETLLNYYNRCDYVLLVSNVVNLVSFIAKVVFSCKSTTQSDQKTFRANVMNKSNARCLALIFIPILSNIIFAILDYKQYKRKEKTQRIRELPLLSLKVKSAGIFDNPECFEEYRKKFPEISPELIQGVHVPPPGDHYPWIRPEDMRFPIMRGRDKLEREVLAFNLLIKIPPKYIAGQPVVEIDEQSNIAEHRVITLFQRHPKDPKSWTVSYPGWTLPKVPFAPGERLFNNPSRFAPLLGLFDTGSFMYEDCTFSLQR